MRLSELRALGSTLCRLTLRRDNTSKHYEAWTKRSGKAPQDEVWTKLSLPSLLFPTLYRKYFPHTRHKYSQETAQKVNFGISIFYVLFAGTTFAFFYDNWKKSGRLRQQEGESSDAYTLRMSAKPDDVYGNNTQYKSYKVSVFGGVSENKNITQEVRQGVLREDGILDKMTENKDYDPYKDEQWVRKRLKIAPDDESFNLEVSGALLRRRDRRHGNEVCAQWAVWREGSGPIL